jgi:hypothetical protein
MSHVRAAVSLTCQSREMRHLDTAPQLATRELCSMMARPSVASSSGANVAVSHESLTRSDQHMIGHQPRRRHRPESAKRYRTSDRLAPPITGVGSFSWLRWRSSW